MNFFRALNRLDQRIAVYTWSVFIIILSLNQYTYAIVNHDDWDYLFKQGIVPGYGTPWERTLWEGRWLNFIYYTLSQHLTATLSFIIFLVLYSSFIGFSSYILAGKRFSSTLAIALFFSPIIGDLSRWPTTITPTMMIMAAGTGILALSRSTKLDNITLLTAVFLLVMTYPSFSSILLVLYAIKHFQDKSLIVKIAIYFISLYMLSVFTIYTINYFFHGYFGIQIQGWRDPSPFTGITDIAKNSLKYFSTLSEATSSWRPFLLLSFSAWVYALTIHKTRTYAIIPLLSVIFWFFIELCLEIKTGIRIAPRSELWVWFAAFIPIALMVFRNDRLLPRAYGIGLLLISLSISLPFWYDIAKNETILIKTVDRLAFEANSLLPFSNDKRIYSYGEPRYFPGLQRIQTDQIRHLQNIMWGGHGLIVQPCDQDLCQKIKHSSIMTPISLVDGLVVLRFGP